MESRKKRNKGNRIQNIVHIVDNIMNIHGIMMKNNLKEIKFYENGKNIAKAFDWVFKLIC